jgi:hypothetical protein
MRKITLVSLIILVSISVADAQRKKKRTSFSIRKKPNYQYELVGSLGATNFLGELGGADQIGTNGLKDLELPLTRPAVGLSVRYKFMPSISGKLNLNYGVIRGDDQLTQEYFRHRRNLHVKSPIVELSFQAEFNFLREEKGHIYRIRGVRGLKRKEKALYVFLGGGGVYFNPQAKYTDGNWYNLQPLKTEGVSYSRITGVLLGGAGFRYAINKIWGIGVEMGLRKTFSDYLDDVSTGYASPASFNGDEKGIYFSNPNSTYHPEVGEQRGDPTDKDSYMFAMITVGYKVMYRKRSRSKF